MNRFAWRLFLRELRSGELRLLFLALTIAVAAVTAVGFFADRVAQALSRQSVQLLGADLLLVADRPWAQTTVDEAQQRGLSIAETRSFPSMVLAKQAQLAEIKAVSSTYPLRGSLRIRTEPGTTDRPVAGGPSPGTVWIEERLANVIQANVGDVVQVGQSGLKVTAILTQELDRGANFFSFAPRDDAPRRSTGNTADSGWLAPDLSPAARRRIR
jgi:putative ABC transport system permease protein